MLPLAQLGKKLATAFAEQIAVLVKDPVAVKEGMDPVFSMVWTLTNPDR